MNYPLRLRYHQAPSIRPPAQPSWLRVSQEIRFWGESWGVMWPIDWIEIRSDATARSESQGFRMIVRTEELQWRYYITYTKYCILQRSSAVVCVMSSLTHLQLRKPRMHCSSPDPVVHGFSLATCLLHWSNLADYCFHSYSSAEHKAWSVFLWLKGTIWHRRHE